MPHLSIAIPTYNRSAELRDLLIGSLCSVVDRFRGKVEVLVGDNSDGLHLIANEKTVSELPWVVHHSNKGNVGFAGNLLSLAGRANGEYIWYLSDNDPLDVEEVIRVVSAVLLRTDSAGFILAYRQTGLLGQSRVIRPCVEKECTLREYVEGGAIPGILLSSTVMPLRPLQERLEGVSREFSGNCFIQVLMFCAAIEESGRIVPLDMVPVHYVVELDGRWPIGPLIRSLEVVVRQLSRSAGLSYVSRMVGERDQIGFFYLAHRARLQRISRPEQARWIFRECFPMIRTARWYKYAILSTFPVPLIRVVMAYLVVGDGTFRTRLPALVCGMKDVLRHCREIEAMGDS